MRLWLYRLAKRYVRAAERHRCPFCHEFGDCIPNCVGSDEFLPRLTAVMREPTR